MATPVRPSNPKQSETEAEVILSLMALGVAVWGLARWAQANAAVHGALDWLTMPVLQMWAEHSPGVDGFLRRSPLFTWLLIQAAMVAVPCFLAVGLYLLATARTRRLRRLARRSLLHDRENADLQETKAKLAAKQVGRPPTASDRPPPGGAATDAERLKDIFRRRKAE